MTRNNWKTIIPVITGLILMGISSHSQDGQSETDRPVIRGFRVPKYNDNMELINSIEGDEAELLENGDAIIRNLRFKFYRDGKVETQVTSPLCTYREKSNQGESEESVRIERDNLVVTGSEYTFDGNQERIEINQDARVVLKSTQVRLFGDTE